ncbi:hypothetical protein LCGC14_3011490, partial [marine sediment metagenome]
GRDGDGTSNGTWNLTVDPGPASYLRVTGTAAMTAGATNELTITAYDSLNNVATAYTGVKSLTFSGPGAAPDSTAPTVEATAIGTAFNVTFTNGESAASAATLLAYNAAVTEVDVSDGTLNSTGDASYDLNVTVNPASASNSDTSISAVSPSPATAGSSVTITVTAYDQYQNALASGTDTVVISVGGANTAAPSVTDNSNGTYTATYTPTASGADAIAGTINGPAIGRDGEGTSNGTWNLTVDPGPASYLRVTGDATMTAGTTNELTIKAYDASDNLATAYTGVKSLTFSGPGAAPDSTAPTVEATAIGTAFNVTFTNGESAASAATLIAYNAAVTEVDVSDGTLNSTGDASYDLNVTVNPASA